MDDQELYREKSAQMFAQAKRAEIPYLKAFYHDVAEHWAHLADQPAAGAMPLPHPEVPPQVKVQ